MKMTHYLGLKASAVLKDERFRDWPVKRRVEVDSVPPEVHYVFPNCGLQFICDVEDGKIQTLFLEKERHGEVVLSEIPFSLRRDEVLSRFGFPAESGEGFSDPILGDFGAHDCFDIDSYKVHFEYRVKSNEIRMITLIKV